MLYNDFSSFIKDQEHLISIHGRTQNNALDYLEGLLLLNQGPPDNWRSSFFPSSDHSRIISQVTKHKIIYCLEIAKYYNDYTEEVVDQVNNLNIKHVIYCEMTFRQIYLINFSNYLF